MTTLICVVSCLFCDTTSRAEIPRIIQRGATQRYFCNQRSFYAPSIWLRLRRAAKYASPEISLELSFGCLGLVGR